MCDQGVLSVCPICGSPDLVHLCSAYLDARANLAARPHGTEGKRGSFSMVPGLKPVSEELEVVGSPPTRPSQTVQSDAKLVDILATGCENRGPAITGNAEDVKKYVVIYLGSAHMDRRFPPQTAMPWVMAEVKRSRDTFKEVQLQITKGCLKALSYEGAETSIDTVFEHNLHSLSRFAKTHQDPRCFAYLQRHSLYSDFECHVFLAHDETVVSCLDCFFLHFLY